MLNLLKPTSFNNHPFSFSSLLKLHSTSFIPTYKYESFNNASSVQRWLPTPVTSGDLLSLINSQPALAKVALIATLTFGPMKAFYTRLHKNTCTPKRALSRTGKWTLIAWWWMTINTNDKCHVKATNHSLNWPKPYKYVKFTVNKMRIFIPS